MMILLIRIIHGGSLVGGFTPSEKYELVSRDYHVIPDIWKNRIQMCQSPQTSRVFLIKPLTSRVFLCFLYCYYYQLLG